MQSRWRVCCLGLDVEGGDGNEAGGCGDDGRGDPVGGGTNQLVFEGLVEEERSFGVVVGGGEKVVVWEGGSGKSDRGV